MYYSTAEVNIVNQLCLNKSKNENIFHIKYFAQCVKVKVKSLSCVQFFRTPWTAAYQAPPSMGFSRQEYWSGLPFLSPGDLPDPGIEPGSPTLQTDTLPSEPPGKSVLPCYKCMHKMFNTFNTSIIFFKQLESPLWIWGNWVYVGMFTRYRFCPQEVQNKQ